nr:MAG TPA: hypothetical protein [Caudoviricetes sp.]
MRECLIILNITNLKFKVEQSMKKVQLFMIVPLFTSQKKFSLVIF